MFAPAAKDAYFPALGAYLFCVTSLRKIWPPSITNLDALSSVGDVFKGRFRDTATEVSECAFSG